MEALSCTLQEKGLNRLHVKNLGCYILKDMGCTEKEKVENNGECCIETVIINVKFKFKCKMKNVIPYTLKNNMNTLAKNNTSILAGELLLNLYLMYFVILSYIIK